MGWIVLLVIVGWMAFKFFGDWNEQGNHVVSEGGMRNKYSTLVNHFLSIRPDCKIFQETRTFIRVGSSTAGGATLFDINQTFGKVTIQWISKSALFGNDKLEWTFDEYEDQDKIFAKMNEDIENYVTKKLKSYT